MQPMVATIRPDQQREQFAQRLRAALTLRFGEQTETAWAEALRRNGVSITQQGLHKWLAAESLPFQARWPAIATALNVELPWLRDGIRESTQIADTTSPYHAATELRPDQVAILQLWEALGNEDRRRLQAVGDALAKPHVTRDTQDMPNS